MGWWKFDDAPNGTSLADASGNGRNGSLRSTDTGDATGFPQAIWTNGINPVINQALCFNGSNTVFIPAAGMFTGTFVTVSLWASFTQGNAQGSFLAAYGSNSLSAPGVFYNRGSNSLMVFSDGVESAWGNIRGALLDASGGYEESSNPALADGRWHHFVFASDSTNFYDWFDGVRDLGSQNGTQGPFKGPVANSWWNGITNINLSFQNNYPTNQPCTLTDIRIYNRVLNDAEVDILYRAPTADQILGAYLY